MGLDPVDAGPRSAPAGLAERRGGWSAKEECSSGEVVEEEVFHGTASGNPATRCRVSADDQGIAIEPPLPMASRRDREGGTGESATAIAAIPATDIPGQGAATVATVAGIAVAADTVAAQWVIHLVDGTQIEATFAPAATLGEVLAEYPDAQRAAPAATLQMVPVPPDIAATLERCAQVGLYGDDDRRAIRAMVALDVDATRVLIANMASRIGRCRRCVHFARPGMSDGYCSGRDDLPEVYGQMHSLPADMGAGCDHFEELSE